MPAGTGPPVRLASARRAAPTVRTLRADQDRLAVGAEDDVVRRRATHRLQVRAGQGHTRSGRDAALQERRAEAVPGALALVQREQVLRHLGGDVRSGLDSGGAVVLEPPDLGVALGHQRAACCLGVGELRLDVAHPGPEHVELLHDLEFGGLEVADASLQRVEFALQTGGVLRARRAGEERGVTRDARLCGGGVRLEPGQVTLGVLDVAGGGGEVAAEPGGGGAELGQPVALLQGSDAVRDARDVVVESLDVEEDDLVARVLAFMVRLLRAGARWWVLVRSAGRRSPTGRCAGR